MTLPIIPSPQSAQTAGFILLVTETREESTIDRRTAASRMTDRIE